MKINNLLIALVFVAIATNMQGQEEWFTYEDEIDQSFVVDFPGAVMYKPKTVETSMGPLQSGAYIHEGETADPNKLYLITKVKYPESTFPPDSIALTTEYLESAIASAAESISGEVVYQTRVEVDIAEYLFRFRYNDGAGVVKGKAILLNDTFYLLQVYCHKDDSLNDRMDQFLASFSVEH